MTDSAEDPRRFVRAIQQATPSIYDEIKVGDSRYWIPTSDLEFLLDNGLRGISLAGLALRTRSRFVKEKICKILGYPIPKRFTKTQPRFLGQLFDVYIQKSNNLQIWNEDVVASRRYVIVHVSTDLRISRVKVVTGKTLASLDSTGTLTRKYQARLSINQNIAELVSSEDTEHLKPFVKSEIILPSLRSPLSTPTVGELFSIQALFDKLGLLIGRSFPDPGPDQERNRGTDLHRLVCRNLGYSTYFDDGQFPDIIHQMLEVKLQISSTIDLGLVSPDSTENLPVQSSSVAQSLRHCDVRYALFCAETDGKDVRLTHLFLTTGEKFFERFPKFGGKIQNKKLQIHLPGDFFAS